MVKLSNKATVKERAEAHRNKMLAKQASRDLNSRRYADNGYIFANISKNHEHYGDTPVDHEKRKLSQKSS